MFSLKDPAQVLRFSDAPALEKQIFVYKSNTPPLDHVTRLYLVYVSSPFRYWSRQQARASHWLEKLQFPRHFFGHFPNPKLLVMTPAASQSGWVFILNWLQK
jgi:hypothetical protein